MRSPAPAGRTTVACRPQNGLLRGQRIASAYPVSILYLRDRPPWADAATPVCPVGHLDSTDAACFAHALPSVAPPFYKGRQLVSLSCITHDSGGSAAATIDIEARRV